MGSFNKFTCELETLEIKITERYYQNENGYIREFTPEDCPNLHYNVVKYLDLSAYSDTKGQYAPYLKKLQRSALNDLLDRNPEIIKQHLYTLEKIEKKFSDLLILYKELYHDFEDKKIETGQLIKKIKGSFIIPTDVEGNISDIFLTHLGNVIMFRQGILSYFVNRVKEGLDIHREKQENDITKNHFNNVYETDTLKEIFCPEAINIYVEIESRLLVDKFINENCFWLRQKKELVALIHILNERKYLRKIPNRSKENYFKYYKYYFEKRYNIDITEQSKPSKFQINKLSIYKPVFHFIDNIK